MSKARDLSNSSIPMCASDCWAIKRSAHRHREEEKNKIAIMTRKQQRYLANQNCDKTGIYLTLESHFFHVLFDMTGRSQSFHRCVRGERLECVATQK